MIEYGTNVVAGVTQARRSKFEDTNVPIFNTLAEAVKVTKAEASAIFAASFAADAILEALMQELNLLCV